MYKTAASAMTALIAAASTVVVTPAPAAAAITPVTRVLVFVEENHSLAQMQAQMPYAYSLAKQYGYATNYSGIRHPSLPNYVAIATGSTQGITDDANPSAHRISGTSVFGAALARGHQAKAYEESMPSNCAQTSSDPYAVKHNPWAYLVPERTACNAGDRPLAALATDAAAGTLPTVGMVVPNLNNDAHDGSLGTADNWFKAQMAKVFAGPDWKAGRLAVVLTADEDNGSAGNKVLTVVIHSSQSHRVVTTALNHYSLCGLLTDVAHASRLGSAARAQSMASAFGLPIG
jgi:phospholipase C